MQTKSERRFPYVKWEQVLAYDPQTPETATASPVVNAVVEAISFVRPLDLRNIALFLGLPPVALSGALFCATGLSFAKFLDKWRMDRLAQIKVENPELKGDHLAQMLGFYDRSALWLFMKRKGLIKIKKHDSHANDVIYWMERTGVDEKTINEYKQHLWQNGITS